MSVHFCPDAGGFLDSAVHDIPASAIAVSAEEHHDLLERRSAGARITVEAGRVVAVAPPVPDIAARRARRVAAVRSEASRRILQIAPIWRQLNDIDLRLRQDADAAKQAEATARRAAIDAIRAASDRIEHRLATMTGKALAAFAVTDDQHWSHWT